MASNRSQSERVAANSARSAGFMADGRCAAGDARIASASRVSASPTLKPLSRRVRANPASRRRAAGPMLSADAVLAAATIIAPSSGDLAQQPVLHLAAEAGAVLVRLDQADHGLVH